MTTETNVTDGQLYEMGSEPRNPAAIAAYAEAVERARAGQAERLRRLLQDCRWLVNEATYDSGAIRASEFEARCAAMVSSIDAVLLATDNAAQPAKFRLGDRVRKTGRSAWQGRVVGTYRSSITEEGYAVESECHPGSVQIYPAEWLEAVGDEG